MGCRWVARRLETAVVVNRRRYASLWVRSRGKHRDGCKRGKRKALNSFKRGCVVLMTCWGCEALNVSKVLSVVCKPGDSRWSRRPVGSRDPAPQHLLERKPHKQRRNSSRFYSVGASYLHWVEMVRWVGMVEMSTERISIVCGGCSKPIRAAEYWTSCRSAIVS